MELFNQARMERCFDIALAIFKNWMESGRFDYTVRPDKNLDGMAIDQLRTEYFTVGVGDNLTDVPFTDLLIIFFVIEAQLKGMETGEMNFATNESGETNFKLDLQVTTDWPDEEAMKMISHILIQYPGEALGKTRQFLASDSRHPEQGDDQQRLGE